MFTAFMAIIHTEKVKEDNFISFLQPGSGPVTELSAALQKHTTRIEKKSYTFQDYMLSDKQQCCEITLRSKIFYIFNLQHETL
jgi:hypothetical protein